MVLISIPPPEPPPPRPVRCLLNIFDCLRLGVLAGFRCLLPVTSSMDPSALPRREAGRVRPFGGGARDESR